MKKGLRRGAICGTALTGCGIDSCKHLNISPFFQI